MYRMPRVIFILVLSIICVSCQGTKKDNIALMKFDTSGLSEFITINEELYNNILSRLNEMGKYNIIESKEFDRLIVKIMNENSGLTPDQAKIKAMKDNEIERAYFGEVLKVSEKYYICMKGLNKDGVYTDFLVQAVDEGSKDFEKIIGEIPDKLFSFEDRNLRSDKMEHPSPFEVRIFKGIEFVYIPPGTFMMGAKADEVGRDLDQIPSHEVMITRGYWIGKYEVTQEQWMSVMDSNPSHFRGDDRPVETVSWFTVQEFIKTLNEKSDGKYRLPTEAEWEFACRGGTTTLYCFGNDRSKVEEYSWFGRNDGETHPVGQKRSNNWGIYDMHGNVWEWTQDWYQENYFSISPKIDPKGPSYGTYKVRRGGSWRHFRNFCRSASRALRNPYDEYPFIGFRLARTF